jgi:ketosteroid isomerase-like protein
MENMKMRTAALLLTTSAVLTALGAPPVAADKRAADAAVIQALDGQWSATAARKDLAGTVAFYADDAVLLPPNAPIARDRESIRKSWAALLDQSTAVSWKVSKAEVAKSGELGYLYGTYELSFKGPKGDSGDTGKLVEIWKKQADGKWKCIVDTYNSDLPVPTAAPADQ